MVYKTKISWTFRIEPDLKKRLEAIAEAERRSLNNMVELLLEEIAQKYESKRVQASNTKKAGKK